MNPAELFEWYGPAPAKESPAETYEAIKKWARRARDINPTAFDKVVVWLQGSGEWTEQQLQQNQSLLMEQVIGRFIQQNQLLRKELQALAPSGIVNEAVFDALDRFDEVLLRETSCGDAKLDEASRRVFQNFSALQDPETRKYFAGSVTGFTGTDSIPVFGYINMLENCDSAVQWTLFMPDVAQRQQNGFRVESFEYRELPPVRFIGIEAERAAQPGALSALCKTLDEMRGCQSGFDYDIILMHHNGKGVDAEPCHALYGRFMKAGAPVPEGCTSIEFVPRPDQKSGAPFASQFAYARFSGDPQAMHQQQSYDVDAMYDVTRNIILGQNVLIPYPDKYWTAEVFPEGFAKGSSAYLFSIQK